MIPAKHECLVSLEMWIGATESPKRRRAATSVPLRGVVTCGCCGEPLSVCWSAGRSAKYPYYLCETRGCVDYRKSPR